MWPSPQGAIGTAQTASFVRFSTAFRTVTNCGGAAAPVAAVITDNDSPIQEAMNQDLSILHLVLNASIVVQAVMLLLMLVSISSWAAIFRKLFSLKKVKAQNEAFERDFWSGSSLNDLFAAATQNARNCGPMERIFASGMREFQKLRERRITDAGTLMDGARRAMRASFQREMDVVETNLSFLASVGGVALCGPVGTFGASCTRSPAWLR